jgi:hypothetical protein
MVPVAATLREADAGGLPEPYPSPTPTPTPKPTPTPSPTPTPTPKPTPTPTPSPTPPPEDCSDFVTGGGWFEPPNSTTPNRVNFGFNAGARGGSPGLKGHVNVVEHSRPNIHIKGTDVTTYTCAQEDPVNCRRFTGPAEIDGETCTYEVLVCDYAEPGRDDRFRIVCGSSTYDNVDEPPPPAGGELDGGNIQLHGRCICAPPPGG